MKFCALWRAENGTNLGVRALSLLKRSDNSKANKPCADRLFADLLRLLEQLTGSQNLAGAVERMFMLRRFGIIGTAIVLVHL